MVVNALLRGGAQINFWQSKIGARQDVHPLVIDYAGILTSGAAKDARSNNNCRSN
jgi:hypothetical protein